mgnify:CR=1 FL=1
MNFAPFMRYKLVVGVVCGLAFLGHRVLAAIPDGETDWNICFQAIAVNEAADPSHEDQAIWAKVPDYVVEARKRGYSPEICLSVIRREIQWDIPVYERTGIQSPVITKLGLGTAFTLINETDDGWTIVEFTNERRGALLTAKLARLKSQATRVAWAKLQANAKASADRIAAQNSAQDTARKAAQNAVAAKEVAAKAQEPAQTKKSEDAGKNARALEKAKSAAAKKPKPDPRALNQQRRVALIIGNDQYATLPGLFNAGTDARGMAEKLRNLGFEVIMVGVPHRSAGMTRMLSASIIFMATLRNGSRIAKKGITMMRLETVRPIPAATAPDVPFAVVPR